MQRPRLWKQKFPFGTPKTRCAWCPRTACPSSAGPRPRSEMSHSRTSLFANAPVCVCNQLRSVEPQVTWSLPPRGQAQCSHFLPPPLLHLSVFPQEVWAAAGGPQGVRPRGLSTKQCTCSSDRDTALHKKPLLQC